MPKGYNFRAMFVVVFYYDANIQKINDKSFKGQTNIVMGRRTMTIMSR